MIVFGSRGSELALTQTRLVAELLRARSGEPYRIEVIHTRGDAIQDRPLPEIGGKGLFTAELEEALRARRIDAAVHSWKDLPVQDQADVVVAAILPRADAADVLVYSPGAADPAQAAVPLAHGSCVGTSSHRRRAALAALRPDLRFVDLRGNVPTRVAKVRHGDCDAVVLAAAGLDRLALDLGDLRRAELPAEICPPAPAQGALAVQCRAGDGRVRALLADLHDPATARCAGAERDLLARLGGGCSMPLGALATEDDGDCRLRAALFAEPGLQPEPGPGLFLDLRGPDLAELVGAAADRWQALVGAPLAGGEVVLLRPAAEGNAEGGDLAAALAVAGARVRVVALTRVVPLAVDQVTDLLPGRALAFTSARAVARFGELAGPAALQRAPVFASGPATAAALRARGIDCTAPADGADGAALARCVAARGAPARGVLFPCASERHDAFERDLAAAAIPVLALPLYRIEPIGGVALDESPGSTLLFTSPSAVRAYAAEPRARLARRVAIGPTTAAALAQHGLVCAAVAAEPTPAAVVHALRTLPCHA